MSIALNIQTFLNKKIKKLKIIRQDFIKDSGIPASVVSGLIKGTHINPSLISIIKIANYFNCSIDTIIGRNQYCNHSQEKIFNKISLDDVACNTKLFILDQLKHKNITTNQLAKLAKIGNTTIINFIKIDSTKKNLSLNSIIAIADALSVSVDEIIGR